MAKPKVVDKDFIVEVPEEMDYVPAVTVKSWVDYLKERGWTEKEIDPVWRARARHGVYRRSNA